MTPQNSPLSLFLLSCRALVRSFRGFARATGRLFPQGSLRIVWVLVVLLLPLVVAVGCKKKKVAPPPPPPVVKPEPPVRIQVEAVVYRLPRALVVAEIFNQPPKPDYTAVLKRMQALAAEKKATLIATTSVAMPNHQRAVVESVLEHRYPTEFDPPQIPQQLGSRSSEESSTTRTVTTTVTTETRPLNFPMTPSTPTNFEARNTGMTLEVESIYQKETDTIQINAVPQFVEFLRNIKYPTELGEIEQPIFYVRKITTSAAANNGEVIFLGNFDPDKSVRTEDDLTDVYFIRAIAW